MVSGSLLSIRLEITTELVVAELLVMESTDGADEEANVGEEEGLSVAVPVREAEGPLLEEMDDADDGTAVCT